MRSSLRKTVPAERGGDSHVGAAGARRLGGREQRLESDARGRGDGGAVTLLVPRRARVTESDVHAVTDDLRYAALWDLPHG